MHLLKTVLCVIGAVALLAGESLASEAHLAIPDLKAGTFGIFGVQITAYNLLLYGSAVICGTLGISLYLRSQIASLPAHDSMLKIADIIYQTCCTYLIQQGKFLIMLFVLIAAAMAYYFMGLQGESLNTTGLVLLFSVVGMIGSYAVAWFGIRVNTYANARTAFAALRGEP
ncbi:MAG: sodium/proton-translocating pyrophosphatase, partial [Planctomycetota bacterium]|nr:sodium/proton-translocating pyrophosphatase [Planctomycetota bacterium]